MMDLKIMTDRRKYIEEQFGSLLEQVSDKDLVEKTYNLILELIEEGNCGKGWDDWSMPFTLNMEFDPKYKYIVEYREDDNTGIFHDYRAKANNSVAARI